MSSQLLFFSSTSGRYHTNMLWPARPQAATLAVGWLWERARKTHHGTSMSFSLGPGAADKAYPLCWKELILR